MVLLPMSSLLIVLGITICFVTVAAVSPSVVPRPNGSHETRELTSALKDVLSAGSDLRFPVVFVTDESDAATTSVKAFVAELQESRSVGVIAVGWGGGGDANLTQTEELSWVIGQARRLRQVSWCLTLVVVSDDPAFLTSISEGFLKGSVLVGPTRVLAVTRLPYQDLRGLHHPFSMTNAMMLIVDDTLENFRCSVYIYLPYTSPERKAMLLAFWTHRRGMVLNTDLQLFPEKFSTLLTRPTLLMAVDELHTRLKGKGKSSVAEYLAQGLNFTYKYVYPSDGAFGTQQADGTWSGMVGMISRKEADFSVAPFSLSARRSEVVDFTWPVLMDYLRILGGRGQPEAHPWGFLFPFEPELWAALLTALVLVPLALCLLASCFFVRSASQYSWTTDTFALLRVLLQQDMSMLVARWWWKRLVYTGWMLMVLVLSKGYASNLMSNLAVRHIDQPFQTLREVLDDPDTTMIWLSNSSFIQYFRSAESGIFHEVAEAERRGRITYQRLAHLPGSANTLVRRGDHVLVEMELFLTMIIGRAFSRTGRCDFYSSRERFLPTVASMIGQKNSQLVPALSKRIMSLTEAGLYNHWFESRIPNSTSCVHPPIKITESASLSLAHLSGIFIVLVVGHTLSFQVLWLEILTKHLNSVGVSPSDPVYT